MFCSSTSIETVGYGKQLGKLYVWEVGSSPGDVVRGGGTFCLTDTTDVFLVRSVLRLVKMPIRIMRNITL